jgi:hypothetical protein
MAAITNTPASIEASPGAVVERVTLGAAAVAGEALYLDGANGWKPTDADAVASAEGRCILVGGGVPGATSFPSGARVDACFFGLVGGYSGMTPDGDVYISQVAGDMDQTAPSGGSNYIHKIGWAFSATEIFVDPAKTTPAESS